MTSLFLTPNIPFPMMNNPDSLPVSDSCPTVSEETDIIRLLLVDDNPGDVLLVQELLRDAVDLRFDYNTADTLGEALDLLEDKLMDVVLLDLSLPDAVGAETIARMSEHFSTTPVVVLSGMDDQSLALHAVREGAQDYLCKNTLETGLLTRTIRHAMERARLQTELEDARQAQMHTQKLESLGILTGGIAHDFNNILGAVMGYAELCQQMPPPPDKLKQYMENIIRGCKRGSDLCRQMLAYAGHAKVNKSVFSIDEVFDELTGFIRISVDRAVTMNQELDHNIGLIEADVSQVRQVLLNFLTNASEALPENGGRITIRTGQCYLRAREVREFYGDRARPGEYVWAEVEDNGCGIERERLDQIFDPFYTTKFEGRGLGLSAVLGIINNHRGAMSIDSAPGKGSRFRVYLPVTSKPRDADDEGAPHPPKDVDDYAGDAAKILIADDEAGMLDWLNRFFLGEGREVLQAVNGAEAIEHCRRHGSDIELALVDITMPGMSAETVFRELFTINPELRLVIITGHGPLEARRRIGSLDGHSFQILHKPFHLSELEKLLRSERDTV